jgi:hypothetical protein
MVMSPVGRFLLFCASGVVAGVAGPAPASDGKLLASLEGVLLEDEAKTLLEPHLDDLKKLDPRVVEKVVSRQWWVLARDIVAKSHTQTVDLSVSVRKAVRTLKDEADELLRTLNPKYGLAQQVSPAFQWAQNDTCIFLTVKYTVRWNAPGALEVTEPSVNMTDNEFNFTGLGKHSNNKYKYSLSLSLFDVILSSSSTWSAASVGKLSVTLRKKWPRKWPRLLANRKTKIGNMHVWMEMQDKMDPHLSGHTTASNSPITCAMSEKLYCLATDTCKKAANCSSCPGKTVPDETTHVCTGMPTEKASLSFKDADMDANEIGGEAKISKARNEFDIDAYRVYFGKDERTKLDPPLEAFIGETRPTGGDTDVSIPMNSNIPETATHLLVFSKNVYGEFATPGSVAIKDAVLPKAKPGPLSFEDEDGEKGEVSGTVTIGKAESEERLDEYALHWGRSATKKLASASYIRDVTKQAGNKDTTHYIARSTKIPQGATHILAFSKNEFGELPSASSLKFVDHRKPCVDRGAPDCPVSVHVTPDLDPQPGKAGATITVEPAPSNGDITHYNLHWGREACSTEGGQSGAKNAFIKEINVAGPFEYVLPMGSNVPEGSTHVLVFAANKYGESDFCISIGFEDNREAAGKKRALSFRGVARPPCAEPVGGRGGPARCQFAL